jgi:hypothetical protein
MQSQGKKACRVKEGKPTGRIHRQAGEDLAAMGESVQFRQRWESEVQELVEGALSFPCASPTRYHTRR